MGIHLPDLPHQSPNQTLLSHPFQVSSYLDNHLGPVARCDNVTLSDGTASTTENAIENGVNAFLNVYPLTSAFTFNQEKFLGFPAVEVNLGE